MKKGARKSRPDPETAAEAAFHRWVAEYYRGRELKSARSVRFAWHAAVRWARQDERRRRSESTVAALVKPPEPVCINCGHPVRYHHPGGCAGGSGAGGVLSFAEQPCACVYVRER
jgi:hypothetical protein